MSWNDMQVGRVREARANVRACFLRREKKHAEYKGAREAYDEAVTALTEILDEELSGQQQLGFTDDAPLPGPPVEQAALDAPAEPAPAAEAKPDPLTATPDDDSWRDVSVAKLAEFGVKPKPIEAMNEANIWNIGHLADFTKAGGELESLKGIGPKAAEAIREACVAFFEAWGKEREKARAEEAAKGEAEAPSVDFKPPATEFDPDSDSQRDEDPDDRLEGGE